MKLAVLTCKQEPCSLRVYYENMFHGLAALGVEIIPFPKAGPIPSKCDLVWDPGLAMRRIPKILKDSWVPVVGTMHGVKFFSLSIRELAKGWKDRRYFHRLKEEVAYDWSWFRKKVAAVVAVSKYGAEEVASAFQLPHSMIHVVYHGVDREIFHVEGEKQLNRRPYFFHVSTSCRNPIKNLQRILAAYAQLPESNRPDLVAVLPDYLGNIDIKGVQLIRRTLSQAELSTWYRGAIGYIFPSLRETFGMPILEAMACGCPVITSNITGCAEVAGNAALLVGPRSVDEIAQSMKCLVDDEPLRHGLRQKGLVRAKQFTWRKSAEKLLDVFQSAIPGA